MNELELQLEKKLVFDGYFVPKQRNWWSITCARCNNEKSMFVQTTDYFNNDKKHGWESTQICKDCFDELVLINHSERNTKVTNGLSGDKNATN